MAEFKVTEGIDGYIEGMRLAGDYLNAGGDGRTNAEGMSLKTAVHYGQQNQKIMQLLELYRALVLKDAADLTEMVASVRETDSSIAGNL